MAAALALVVPTTIASTGVLGGTSEIQPAPSPDPSPDATPDTTPDAPAEVAALAEARQAARAARDFAESDRLRDEILAAGWVVRDGAGGWELVPA